MIKRGWAAAFAVAAVAAAATGGAAAAASRSDDTKSPELTYVETSDVPARQAELEVVADQLNASAEQPGFGGVAVDVEARRVTLWWRGDVPADVQRVVDSADVTVRVSQAAFTDAELEKAAEVVNRFVPDDRSYSVDAAFSQNIKQMTPTHGVLAWVTLKDSSRPIASIEAELTRAAGLPVSVDPTQGAKTFIS